MGVPSRFCRMTSTPLRVNPFRICSRKCSNSSRFSVGTVGRYFPITSDAFQPNNFSDAGFHNAFTLPSRSRSKIAIGAASIMARRSSFVRCNSLSAVFLRVSNSIYSKANEISVAISSRRFTSSWLKKSILPE